MTVHVLTTGYQSAGEKASIQNWLNHTVALRIDKVNTDDKGAARSVGATVFTPADLETGDPARIESTRIIGQLAGFDVGDIVIVHVVAYGKRGQVLAPPPENDKDAAALSKAFTA